MTITLTPNQEKAIQDAIQAGFVRSVDEFIDTAIEALGRRDGEFGAEKARRAGARIRELRRDVRLRSQP
jgi:Arc/MetJ-type ribon-helix-helix transcriptional regulator